MLNLNHFAQLCTRLHIKDRDTGQIRPFVFNPSQKKIMRGLYERQEQKKPLWVMHKKGRRLGISTFWMAMMLAQQFQKKNCSGQIVAQLKKTALELHNNAKVLGKQLPMHLPDGNKEEIFFPHSGGQSVLSWATAQTAVGGRGQTVNGLLMSEAAFYPTEDVWVALLNMVSSRDPDNIVVVETTPNGMAGPGETYYNYWTDALEGKNDFFPVFLPWFEDPSTFLPNVLAEDAPADDYEKWLMTEFKCTKGQIAWHRQILATKCAGSLQKWRAEYPSNPFEGFISTGDPAFDFNEIEIARRTCCDPIAKLRWAPLNRKVNFEESKDGVLWVWEYPKKGDHYYIGVDAAKGIETGDFAAMVCFNAETGEQAWRLTVQFGPEVMAAIADHMGRWYNNAMINIEETGGWGWIVIRDLRDRWKYPTQYLWMGMNDRPDRKPRSALGWVMTQNSRRRLFENLRASVRTQNETNPKTYTKVTKNGYEGREVDRMEITIRDIELVQQMSRATMQAGYNWKILKGHDDNFIAAGLAWVACKDHHYPHSGERKVSSTLQEQQKGSVTWLESPESNACGLLGWTGTQHLDKLTLYNKNKLRKNTLEGI